MSQIRRIAYALKVTVGMALATVLYFRFGEQLFGMAKGQFSGPFTHVVETLEIVVPVAIGIILFSTWGWVLVSAWQEERSRSEAPRAPR